jgi:acetoacetyl-CoA synthetase
VTDEPLWTPGPARVAASLLARFMAATGHESYPDLHRWSVTEPEAFWAAVWDATGVVGDRGARVVERGATFAATRFFPDGRLNVGENLLRRRGAVPAVIAWDEDGRRGELSWDELAARSRACAAALRDRGVVPGARIAAVARNTEDTIVLAVAAATIGAVLSTVSPDFGTAGILDRFGQIEPHVLVTCRGYRYAGTWYDTAAKMDEVVEALRAPAVLAIDELAGWSAPDGGDDVPFERFAFDQPLSILFSSGTTGKPKCIVHRAGGVLLQHLKEQQLHCDVRPGDRLMYFTTTGWMMWNWLLSALASGATIVLFDGQPFTPHPGILFDIVDADAVTLLGVSAKWIDAQRQQGRTPRATHDLSSLRTICSTGSPLVPAGFEWVYADVKPDVHLASISGGTDLCGCLVGGDPTSPVYRGELQRPALGLDTDVAADDGSSLRRSPGVAGELVCRTPFPSMPLGFWGDADGVRYHAAYFERFPTLDVWAHGDFASWTEHGGMVIHGRSDATLNPGGVRIGTADIYRAVEALPEVAEALAFGQQMPDGDTRVVLLVVLAGATLDADLEQRIRAAIRTGCSPRHVPAVIAAVADLPRTRSNKLVELAVADVVNGRPVRNVEALANPDALFAIRDLPELAT